ncbi:MAG TPA: SLC13 family permease [Anaerolineales bacterium]|jgi:anion transporter
MTATAIPSKPASLDLGKYTPQIGAIAGLLLAAIIWNLPLEGLSPEGKKGLAISLCTVVWWATKVMHPGFTSLAMLIAYVLFGVAKPADTFGMFTNQLIYLVVGGYLIAAAVTVSGLGKRIAYAFLLKFVSSFQSVIISAYALTFVLSFLIPHPWPRAFLIMGVMAVVIKSANLSKRDAANIGLAVFAGSAPVSMILLTGDSAINVLAVSFSGKDVSWLQWLLYMGIPAAAASILCCFLQLKLFPPTSEFKLNKDDIKKQLVDLGSLTAIEKRTIFWVAFAIVLWMTDSVHHIALGWVTVAVALGMALPVIGGILKPAQWKSVPIETLFFLTAAIAIGKVGAITGMNAWIASAVLPKSVPANPFLMAGLIAVIAVILHMLLGSVIAVMGIATPALVGFATAAGINPIVPALMVYTAIAMHWVLPFHHMNVLVGLGEENGGYMDAEVIKLGLPMTVVVFIVTVLIQVPWWKLVGLL